MSRSGRPSLLLPALAVLVAGCGYTTQRDMSMERSESGRLPAVAVAPFDNATFRRGLEIRLTRLIADEVRARGPRAAANRGSEDWLLEGTIRAAEERVLSDDTLDRVRQSSFVVTVDITLKDRTTEKVIGSDSFTTREPFSDRAGRIATLEQAEEEALRDMAESIVYWLEARRPKES